MKKISKVISNRVTKIILKEQTDNKKYKQKINVIKGNEPEDDVEPEDSFEDVKNIACTDDLINYCPIL